MIQKLFHPISKFIWAIRYQKTEQGLEWMTITFKDDKIKEYKPVFSLKSDFSLEFLYEEFIKQDSVGKFWHKFIKENPSLDCKNIR